MNNEYQGALLPGAKLQGGVYTIEKLLGHGGTGFTYLASMTQQLTGNLGGFNSKVDVAIKEFYLEKECQRGSTLNVVIPNTNFTAKVEQYKRSFIREAKRIAGLSHPNIVHVLGIFEENDTVYYVMQYIRGGSIKENIEKSGPISEKRTVKYAIQVASALDYMHKKHMCHYDMKPGNIMISSDDNAMLIDFGIAKNYDDNGQETSTTPPGLSKGYAPLEQYTSISEFSPKIDVYSLGATIYSMLLGVTPPEPMMWINKPFSPKPDNVSDKLWNIMRKALSLAPKDRPTMEELLHMLQNMEHTGGSGDMGEDKTYYKDTDVEDGHSAQNMHHDADDKTIYGDDAIQNPYNPYNTKTTPEKKPEEVKVGMSTTTGHKKKNNALFIIAAIILGLAVAFGVYSLLSYAFNGTHKTETEEKDTTTVSTIYDANGQAAMTFSGTVVNGQPQGKGVMIYMLDKDKDRYEGGFVNGLREDSTAALFYKNGDIYRGAFIADHFSNGAYYVNETGESFRGKFKDDQPWNGVWYDKHNNVLSRIDKGVEK